MLATTRAPARRARATSDRWPAWIAPIVGTNATRAPRARSAATARRSAATLRTRRSRGARAGAPRRRARPGRPATSVRLRVRGEAPRLDVRHVAGERVAHRLAERGVAAHELRHVPEREPEQVGRDQHLPVALRARADADRGD